MSFIIYYDYILSHILHDVKENDLLLHNHNICDILCKKEADIMEFRDRIKELRQEKNISAAGLAESLGKSESAIRMWEAGKNKPDADTLIELSKMFGYTTDYLLGLEVNARSENVPIGNLFGLSDKSIDVLTSLSNAHNSTNEILLINVLNAIIEHPEITDFLSMFAGYTQYDREQAIFEAGALSSDNDNDPFSSDDMLHIRSMLLIEKFKHIVNSIKKDGIKNY